MIPKGWCEDPAKSKFAIRLYTILPCSTSEIVDFAAGQSSFPTEDGVPIWLGLCEFEAKGLVCIKKGLVHSDPVSGSIIVPTSVENLHLPRSSYFLLATPHEIDGVAFKEIETLSRLNRAEALLSIHFGSNAVYCPAFQAIYDARPEGQYSVFGDVMAVVQPSDGPTMTSGSWQAFEEVCSKIELLQDADKKARIRRALEFYHSGKDSDDTAGDEKFFFYWTAIQILCSGEGTKAINQRLQTIYGFTKDEVEEKLFWKGIIEARNLFFHRGQTINFHKDVERYIQLLFLDLLRHDIGVVPICAALLSQPGLDLSVFSGRD